VPERGCDRRYQGGRPDLARVLDAIPEHIEECDVLDVGCADGSLAADLLSRGAASVVGIEPDPSRAKAARQTCQEVIALPIELALPQLEGRQFDMLVAADVLEHLVDPWVVIQQLAPLLRRDGIALISVPNAANARVILQLLICRDWAYRDSGLFDRTHLRWFGRRSLRQLIESANLRPASWYARANFVAREGTLEATVSPGVTRLLPAYLVKQWVVLCVPS
jgi:2-polyprenyl-3-methyl-5-hydroxy-6-metoxy-1,4-benzoquinol methylase